MNPYKIDITPGTVKPRVYVSQYDVGREIRFLLFDRDIPYTPASGTVIVCEGTKQDGTGFASSTTWANNVVTVVTDADMTDVRGVAECELVLYLDGDRIGTVNFLMLVEKAGVNEETIFTPAQIAYVADALTQIAGAEQYANRAETAADRAEACANTTAWVYFYSASNGHLYMDISDYAAGQFSFAINSAGHLEVTT